MAKLIKTVLVLHSLWMFAVTQRLCSEQPPYDRDITSCCSSLPNVIDSGLNSACQSNFSKNSQMQLKDLPPNETPKGNCMAECIANRTQIYRGNGLIDRVFLLRIFLNAVSGMREWEGIVANTVNMCLNETRLKAEELRQSALMRASFPGEIICHPISGYLLGCMNTELFKRCPNMTSSVECDGLKQYAGGCHIPPKYV